MSILKSNIVPAEYAASHNGRFMTHRDVVRLQRVCREDNFTQSSIVDDLYARAAYIIPDECESVTGSGASIFRVAWDFVIVGTNGVEGLTVAPTDIVCTAKEMENIQLTDELDYISHGQSGTWDIYISEEPSSSLIWDNSSNILHFEINQRISPRKISPYAMLYNHILFDLTVTYDSTYALSMMVINTVDLQNFKD